MQTISISSFVAWRNAARDLLQRDIEPSNVTFIAGTEQKGLFSTQTEPDSASEEPATARKPHSPGAKAGPRARVPNRFLKLAETVACHRSESRFNLLYRTLWRLTHREPDLLEIATDDDVHQLHIMEKAVRRDAHKMKAFVRFRKLEVVKSDGARAEHFVAWHRPDHQIARITGPFFARRFPTMNWSILGPIESVHWDQDKLTYGPGVPRSDAPTDDDMEELWKTYYASTFNPARIKLKAMTQEMPVRYWSTMPETDLIPDLLDAAPARVDEMISRQEGLATSAADYFPAGHPKPSSAGDALQQLNAAAAGCEACPLCQPATQTVFGEGPATARIVIVGEQPGDHEDLAGRPFVGPAGDVLTEILGVVGFDRKDLYLTNSVKHFKFEPRGKRRIHARPNVRELSACRPWLEAELNVIQPTVILCLGVTAAQTVIGRHVRLNKHRGKIIATEFCEQTIATYHPSALLRSPSEQRQRDIRQAMIEDFTQAARLVTHPNRQQLPPQ